MSRLELSTTCAPTRPGVARQYTRENILELAFLAALTRIGWRPSNAAAFLRDQRDIERETQGRHSTWVKAQWAAFPAGDVENWAVMSADDPCKFRLDDLTLSSPCHAASVIHVAKIVEIVDQLFAEREASSWEFALPQ